MPVDLTPCPCGSGLRSVRCCGLDLATLAAPQSAEFLLPLVERARQAFNHGLLDTAEQLSINVLDLAPDQPGALDTLRRVRAAQDRPQATLALLERFVALYPNETQQSCDLAMLLMKMGNLAGAEGHARNAVRGAPTDVQAHNVLAMIFTEAHRPSLGEHHYRQVLRLSGQRDPIVLANLAWALAGQGKMAEARLLYEESTVAAPAIVQSWLGWARMEEADHNLQRASVLLGRAEERAPDHRGVRLSRAVLQGRLKRHAEAAALLDDPATATPDEWLERGRQLASLGRPDEAFAAWQAGKLRAQESAGVTYAAEDAQSLAARLKSFFTAGRLSIMPRASTLGDHPQPIFILGFPRSGTTLVEQSLSAHTMIAAGDELPFIGDVAQELPRLLNVPYAYPEALAELWIADQHDGLDLVRDHYLRRVRQRGIIEPDTVWFTDKMPLNEMHAGLIALLFPKSPMIHMLRHPLDVVLSVFSHNLTHGFNCASSLQSAARHYVLVMDLMEHYRAEMALRYLPVRYEDILADQEGEMRRVLAFIGLPYDAACLRFHDNKRRARTASYAQISEGLNTKALGRYRRYLDHLQPVLPILEPVIHRLGYTIES